jgi:hypothetical protein
MFTIYNLINSTMITFESYSLLFFASVIPESSISLAFININTSIEPFNVIILFSNIVPIKIYPNADLNKEEIIQDNKNKAGVYQFTNLLTGASYVGSSINLNKRFRQYYNYNYISSPARGKSIIYSSLLSYGYSNFSLTILEYCEIKDTINREDFYINVISPAMNILQVAGNSLGYKHTEDSLSRMSTIKKSTYLGPGNNFYGKSHTIENIQLFSEIAKTRIKLHNAKPVILTDSNHELIQNFESMTALALYLKADKGNLAKYRDTGKLFRNSYYIKSINNK